MEVGLKDIEKRQDRTNKVGSSSLPPAPLPPSSPLFPVPSPTFRFTYARGRSRVGVQGVQTPPFLILKLHYCYISCISFYVYSLKEFFASTGGACWTSPFQNCWICPLSRRTGGGGGGGGGAFPPHTSKVMGTLSHEG